MVLWSYRSAFGAREEAERFGQPRRDEPDELVQRMVGPGGVDDFAEMREVLNRRYDDIKRPGEGVARRQQRDSGVFTLT